MRITLSVTEGPGKGRTFAFDGHDFFLVGRSPKAHFRLPQEDRSVSRIHFLVEVNAPVCRILDMNSHNGTHVNGKKIERCDLKDGDIIRAGKNQLRVSVVADDPADQSTIALEVPRVEAEASPPPAPPPPGTNTLCPICGVDVNPSAEGRGALLCLRCQDKARKQPQLIDGYQIVQVLGQGGMGIVYQGINLADGRVVAIKTFLPKAEPSPKELARFLRDTAILRQLQHPHIVSFLELGQTAKAQLFCIMEFVPGSDAGRILHRTGPLAVPRAVGLVDQLLDALEYAHAKGFVHRDIKPANLLVTTVDGKEFVFPSGRPHLAARGTLAPG